MSFSRFPTSDPRTVARDIPGIMDAICPLLTPGIVAYFNRMIESERGIKSVCEVEVSNSKLAKAMLFEIAVVYGEQRAIGTSEIDWSDCLKIAHTRQVKHYDAVRPTEVTDADMLIAKNVGDNLVAMLKRLQSEKMDHPLTIRPKIPGYQWISSGVGDFSIGQNLIEVKCTSRRFSSADFRQIIMYWLLSYINAIEKDEHEWETIIFLNPRLNYVLELKFSEILELVSGGKAKVEIKELFASIVCERLHYSVGM